MKPPAKIDQADVLYWDWSGDTPFGIVPDTEGNVYAEIFGVAVCWYGKPGEYYRFVCNRYWETMQDALYDSVESAMNLPQQYRMIPVNWKKYVPDIS